MTSAENGFCFELLHENCYLAKGGWIFVGEEMQFLHIGKTLDYNTWYSWYFTSIMENILINNLCFVIIIKLSLSTPFLMTAGALGWNDLNRVLLWLNRANACVKTWHGMVKQNLYQKSIWCLLSKLWGMHKSAEAFNFDVWVIGHCNILCVLLLICCLPKRNLQGE